jgi:hypothetical protein
VVVKLDSTPVNEANTARDNEKTQKRISGSMREEVT